VSEKGSIQAQTAESFGFKWKKFPVIDKKWREQAKKWFLDMYNFTLEGFKEFIDGKKVLDAGCGMAWRTDWFKELNQSGIVVGIDIAREAVKTGKRYVDADIILGDLGGPPFPSNFFDYIACEGVIHHTPDPQRYLACLVKVLKPNGLMSLYIYKKKPLLRELADSAIREKTTIMSVEECLEFCKKITELGRELYKVNKTIEVPDIPLLGVKGGRYTVQSFIYQYFLKCFWDWDDQDYEESLAVNFDWYHPGYAYSFSKKEVKDLLTNSGLEIENINELMSAFAVKAKKSRSLI